MMMRYHCARLLLLILGTSDAFLTRTPPLSASVPCVTPKVTASIYTQNDPSSVRGSELYSHGSKTDNAGKELPQRDQPWFASLVSLKTATSLPLWSLALAALISVTVLPPIESASAAATTTTVKSVSSSSSSFGEPAEKRLRDSAKAAVDSTTANLIQTGRNIDATKADYGKALRAVNQQKAVVDRAEISLRTEQARLDRIKKSASRESILRQKERVGTWILHTNRQATYVEHSIPV